MSHLHCAGEGHCCHITSSHVHQTLDEMEFERGIWSAAQTGELDRVYELINKGTDPNQCDNSGYSALHYAARNGHLEVCSYLLSRGANLDATTRAGNATALHRACTAGQRKIVELLISKGADLRVQDADGKTAMHRAAEKGHVDIYNLLVTENRSLLVECRDNKGKLPSDYLNSNV